MNDSDPRLEQIRRWLASELHGTLRRIEPASADASFRRYFRAWRADGATRIVMDAPPEREDLAPYLRVSAQLERCGVHVPRIDAVDSAQGFVLLEDLGSVHYLARLGEPGGADALYRDALEALVRIQTRGAAMARSLARYDRELLSREMALMPEWFCVRHLQFEPGSEGRALLAAVSEFLCAEALAQPTVFVHRDYHSRNLMVTRERNPGIVDFQDAVDGPAGYDLVSLLKDCYVGWPRAQVEQWVDAFRARLVAEGGAGGADRTQFLRWFDLAGLQRHLKVLGIFARLWYRDGKPGYLDDLPRTLGYVVEVARAFPELREFSQWLDAHVVPRLAGANTRVLAARA
jgi:aminoglycoside/choline kinase family phosphotransferase